MLEKKGKSSNFRIPKMLKKKETKNMLEPQLYHHTYLESSISVFGIFLTLVPRSASSAKIGSKDAR